MFGVYQASRGLFHMEHFWISLLVIDFDLVDGLHRYRSMLNAESVIPAQA